MGHTVTRLPTSTVSRPVVVQAWASLNSLGAVCFWKIWVGDSTGGFDGKGSPCAFPVVADVRGNGYTHARGKEAGENGQLENRIPRYTEGPF